MLSGSSIDNKERVKQAINIVDLVGDYLQVRREGRAYKALCPWHDDSRPSLQINPERQSFKCWVCDIGGDIFSFVMKMENLSFPEALELLAERAGITLERTGRGAGGGDDKRLLYQAMAWVEERYHEELLKSEGAAAARKYLDGRGITAESIRRCHLGFAPESWEWIAAQARGTRYTPQVLETIGVLGKRQSGNGYYDRFRGRILFSIRDTQGRSVGLGGRVLPGGTDERAAKYINSPETPIYSKSNLLYGLDLARDAITKQRSVVVMEGYTDCLVAQQCGVNNAVAVLGTAFGERHLQLLRRYADQIVLVLDGDEAGRKRSDQLLELFIAEPIDLRILTLPDNLDPCDFLLNQGPAAFQELLAGANDALEHKFRTATGSITATSGVHEANRALEEVLATLAKAPRLQAAGMGAARLKEEQVLNRLAAKFGLSEERIRTRLTSLRRAAGTQRSAASRIEAQAATSAPVKSSAPQLDSWERELLEVVLQIPDYLDRVREEILAEQLSSPLARAILSKCYELSGCTSLFDRLLVEFEDAELKSLLVDLDERGRAKGTADMAARLEQVLTSYRRRRELGEQRRQAAQLVEQPMDEQAQLAILQQIISRERSRQGISLPTDG